MTSGWVRLATILLASGMFAPTMPSPLSAGQLVYDEYPFSCSVPIIDPLGEHDPSRNQRDTPSRTSENALPANGMSNIDFFRGLHQDFSLAATFTLPLDRTNRGVFYSNWLILKSRTRPGFVQLELMRWKKYNYRQELGLTWAIPGYHFAYRDTGVFLSDTPHRLSIAVKDRAIQFAIDGRTVCRSPISAFFTRTESLFYQVGTEVSELGDHPVGDVSGILLKRQADFVATTPRVTCVYRGYGVTWESIGHGTYRAEGVFDATEPYYRFTGERWDQPCRF